MGEPQNGDICEEAQNLLCKLNSDFRILKKKKDKEKKKYTGVWANEKNINIPLCYINTFCVKYSTVHPSALPQFQDIL